MSAAAVRRSGSCGELCDALSSCFLIASGGSDETILPTTTTRLNSMASLLQRTAALNTTRLIALRSASLARHASTSTSSAPPNPAPGAPKPNSPFVIFDRQAKVLQKSRAATRRALSEDGTQWKGEPGEPSRMTDYAKRHVAESVAERVLVSCVALSACARADGSHACNACLLADRTSRGIFRLS